MVGFIFLETIITELVKLYNERKLFFFFSNLVNYLCDQALWHKVKVSGFVPRALHYLSVLESFGQGQFLMSVACL